MPLVSHHSNNFFKHKHNIKSIFIPKYWTMTADLKECLFFPLNPLFLVEEI